MTHVYEKEAVKFGRIRYILGSVVVTLQNLQDFQSRWNLRESVLEF
jgi:hypothetical protein